VKLDRPDFKEGASKKAVGECARRHSHNVGANIITKLILRQARTVVDHGDRHDKYQDQQENYRKTELGIVQHSVAQFKFGCDVIVSHFS